MEVGVNFYLGQKVVCVVKVPPFSSCGEICPEYGVIYTVRGLGHCPIAGDGIYLEEIHNPPVACVGGTMERYFENWGFRPAVERKTDISIFTAMLTNQKVDA